MTFKLNLITHILCLSFILINSNLIAQNNLQSDLNFEVSDDFLNNPNIQLGVKLHPNKEQIVEGISIKDYVLVHNDNEILQDFYYDETNPSVDKIVVTADALNRAVINIAYWGIDNVSDKSEYLFNKNSFKYNPSIISFISDLVTSGFNNQSMKSDLKLVVIQFKSKTSDPENDLTYQSLRERIKLQSRYLYLIWDKSNKEKLPNMFSNSNYKIYNLNSETILDQIYHDPLVFSDAPIIIEQNATDYFARIEFSGKFSDSLLLGYEVYDVNKRLVENGSAYAKDGINIKTKLPAYDLLPDEFIKVNIIYPPEFNISLLEEKLSENWQGTNYSLNIRRSGKFELKLSKVPDFHFFYLDLSSMSNIKRDVIKEIYDKIEFLVANGDTYILFISNGIKPILASGPDDYYDALSRSATLQADPPNTFDDIDWILKNINWEKEIQSSKNTEVNFYFPENTYKFKAKKLIDELLFTIDPNKNWTVNIIVDSKKIKKIKAFRYDPDYRFLKQE